MTLYDLPLFRNDHACMAYFNRVANYHGICTAHPPWPEVAMASRIVWSERHGIVEVDWRSPMVSIMSNRRVREFVPHPILDDERCAAIVAGRVNP